MKVLICSEKHGTNLYDASTPEALAEASIHVLKDRMDQGWYWRDDDDHPTPITDEEIEALPEAYKAQAKKDQARDRRRIKEGIAANVFYDEVKRVIDEHDTSSITLGRGKYERQVPVAWDLLDSRSDYEYEHVEVETVWQPEG